MLIKIVYFYEVVTGVDMTTFIIRNNFGQRELIFEFSNKTTLEQEITTIKNRLNTTGLYKDGLFYPRTGELTRNVSNKPIRQKILVKDEYLRS